MKANTYIFIVAVAIGAAAVAGNVKPAAAGFLVLGILGLITKIAIHFND